MLSQTLKENYREDLLNEHILDLSRKSNTLTSTL